MRKHLIWTLAIACLAAFASAAIAVPNTQVVTGGISPRKLPKHHRAPITLLTDVSATNSGNPYQVPNPTTIAKVDYDKDGAFQQKGLPTCNPSEFTAATTTEEAKQACSDAIVGSGTSKIAIPLSAAAPPLDISAATTVFNAKHKTALLHTYNPVSGAQTLIGRIGKADAGPPPNGAGPGYGLTLTVPVPPLAGGSAVITEFNAKVRKVYRFKGKKRSIYTARCGRDKTLRIQARFTDDQGQVATASASESCKQKKG